MHTRETERERRGCTAWIPRDREDAQTWAKPTPRSGPPRGREQPREQSISHAESGHEPEDEDCRLRAAGLLMKRKAR